LKITSRNELKEVTSRPVTIIHLSSRDDIANITNPQELLSRFNDMSRIEEFENEGSTYSKNFIPTGPSSLVQYDKANKNKAITKPTRFNRTLSILIII
jgi:hypothetical protein